MSSQTNNLGLPYILPSQAQKHVTHNEALRLLDGIVQLSVADRDRAEPDAAPAEGERHIVAAGGSGAWAGKDGQVAMFQDDAWAFLVPREGWLVWVSDEAKLLCRHDDAWSEVEATLSILQDLELLGVGTTADAANPFAAKLNKALWTARPVAEGGDGDLRYTLNKEAGANVLSLLLQSGWSGRAEFGLVGSDDVTLKVSPDGANWHEALAVDGATGAASFPSGLNHHPSGAPFGGIVFTPGGDGVVSIWRLDNAHAQNPRAFTVSGVSGDTLTLSTADAGQIFHPYMEGVSYARIWNTTKAPNESAWVKAAPSADTLQIVDPASIAGWSGGETVQIGDPTAQTPGRVIALDISPMQEALFGSAFAQAGVVAKANLSGGSGDVLALSPSGVSGSFVGTGGTDQVTGTTMISCTTPSPISNSNLGFRARNDRHNGDGLAGQRDRPLGINGVRST